MGTVAVTALGVIAFIAMTGSSVAQIITPKPQPVCRKLAQGDRFYPQYQSCCDVDGGHSQWKKSDGSVETRVSICGLWGIQPADPALNLTPPASPKASRDGIPSGNYSCTLVAPVTVTIRQGGQYSLSDGSLGRFELAERSADYIGAFARYKITGGSFDGFFFLHRDNGQLQVGRTGWTRCAPLR